MISINVFDKIFTSSNNFTRFAIQKNNSFVSLIRDLKYFYLISLFFNQIFVQTTLEQNLIINGIKPIFVIFLTNYY